MKNYLITAFAVASISTFGIAQDTTKHYVKSLSVAAMQDFTEETS